MIRIQYMSWRMIVLLAVVMLTTACSNNGQPRPEPETVQDARQMQKYGLDAFAAGRYQEAIENFHAAEKHFMSVDDPRGVAIAAISQAESWLIYSETDKAGSALARAIEATKRIENAELDYRLKLLQARVREPGRELQQLLDELRHAPEPIAAQATLLACEHALASGKPQCAEDLSSEDPLTMARMEQLKAEAATLAGHHSEAIRHLDFAAHVFRESVYRPGLASVYETRARLHAERGEYQQAADALKRALYLRLWIRDRIHSIALVDELATLVERSRGSERDEALQRYDAWRNALREEETPEWDAMLDDLIKAM